MIAPANFKNPASPESSAQPQRISQSPAVNHADTLPAGSQSVGRRKGRARRTLTWVATGLLAAATFATIEQPWKSRSGDEAHAALPAVEALRVVNVASPAPAEHDSVVLPASVRPWQTATLHARVSGYLTAWHRDLGASVMAGELLAEIETPELDQQLAEAEALASEAVASAVQSEAELVEAEADLKVAEAQLVRVQAEVALAESQLARREKLLAKRTVTEEEFETFEREVEARSADVVAAEADVTRRRTNLQTRAAVIDARHAFAKSRRSNVDRLRELQGFKRIVAPFDGVVTQRAAEVGMLVTEGKEPLFVIEDMSRVRVQINVPQSYSMQTRPGVAALIRLPDSPLQAVQGEITRVAESVDAANRTMLAEIELKNDAYHFQPGSYVQVTLNTDRRDANWTIPTSALSMRVEGPHVVVVNDREELEVRKVELGRDLGSRVVVAAGIQGGERLVINPTDDLTGGVRVQVHVDTLSGPSIAQR